MNARGSSAPATARDRERALPKDRHRERVACKPQPSLDTWSAPSPLLLEVSEGLHWYNID